MLKIFLGSSSEALEHLSIVSTWIEEAGHNPIAWNDPKLFPQGKYTSEKATTSRTSVDAAVFIFSEGDKISYWADFLNLARNNLLIKDGIFSGEFSQAGAIICKVGEPKIPTELHGSIILDISLNNRSQAQVKFRDWLEEQELIASAPQSKVCILGSFGVGKTSLVSRYVKDLFSEKYQTTLGVKVDKKIIKVNEGYLKLLLWDLEGVVSKNGVVTFSNSFSTYLRGTKGFLIVADGTRRDTLQDAQNILKLAQKVREETVPSILLINKSDLTEDWKVDAREIKALTQEYREVMTTSAKTGMNVEAAFLSLAKLLLED